MNCESCGNRMTAVYRQSHFQCMNCNRFHFPTEIESAEDSLRSTDKVTEFQCPRCKIALEVGTLRGHVDVCYCPNCRGFVIDCDTLGSWITELRAAYAGPDDQPLALDPQELDVRRDCPACQEPLEAHPYYGPGNSVIDTCTHCRLAWFDHGELAWIVRAPGLRRQSTLG